MEVVPGLIVAYGDVEQAVRLNYRHQQALRVGLGPRPLLNNLARFDDLKGLLSGDASLIGSEQRVVAPFDAPDPRGCANGVD